MQIKTFIAQKKVKRIWFPIIPFIIMLAMIVGYFIIGRQTQLPPKFIPENYFRKTRINPNLSESENGFKQLRKLIGDTISGAKFEEFGWNIHISTGAWLSSSYGGGNSGSQYNTFSELLTAHPEARDEKADQQIKQRENSGFFDRLTEIVEMERKNDDKLPTMQGIQSLERNFARLVAYYTDQNETEKAVNLNILALKLGDKYLTQYNNVVEVLIALVCNDIAMRSTQYLLTHATLTPQQTEKLTSTYKNIFTISQKIAFERMMIGEYHMTKQLANDFNFVEASQLSTVGINENGWFNPEEIFSMLSSIMVIQPLYEQNLTLQKYSYAMHEFSQFPTNNKAFEKVEKEIWFPSRNIYNFFGNNVLQALFPRLQGTTKIMEETYQQKVDILTQLSSWA